MNFRTFTLLGAVTVVFALASLPSSPVTAAGALKLTGPEGQTRVEVSQYGPTTRADTFWSIAQKTRPNESVSVYQVMAAIFEANPHAFTSDNYNSLEKGMILAIPSLEAIKAIPASLAKARAEQDDKAWQELLRKEAEKPTPADVIAVANAQAVEKASAELDKVSESLVEAQNRNLNLTDELGRALDQLVVVKNDNENLKAKIQDLTERVATLEQELIASREQNQGLKQKVEQLEWEANQAAIPQEQPSFLMSPLGLGIISAIVSLLLLTGLWLVLKRKSGQAANSGSGKAVATVAAGAVAAAAADSFEQDEMAVQLDQPDDSIDSLLDAGDVDLKPEADLSDDPDMYVADEDAEPLPEPDESQSLDDLWAEAMGEQEEGEARRDEDIDVADVDVEPQDALPDDDLEPFDEGLDSDGDDVDSLIAGLESDLGAPVAVENDAAIDTDDIGNDDADEVLASLDAELDEAMAEFGGAEEADPDALLASLSASAEPEDTTASKLDAELDEAMAEFDSAEEADPDALLASLSASNEPEDTTASELDAELDEAMAEFGSAEEADPDALLASLSASNEPEDTTASELGAELDEAMAEFDSAEETDPDALLASLSASAEPEDTTASELDAELDEAMAEFDSAEEADPDALLASLSASAEPEDSTAAELDAELDEAMAEFGSAEEADPDAPDALLASLSASAEPADTTAAELDAELDEAMAEFGGAEEADPDAPDALLASLSASAEPEDTTASALDAELDEAMAEFGSAEFGGAEEADPDALLTSLSASNEPEDTTAAELDAELDEAMAEFGSAEFDSVEEADPDALLVSESASNEPEDTTAAELDAELDEAMAEFGSAEEVDPDALLASLSASAEPEEETSAEMNTHLQDDELNDNSMSFDSENDARSDAALLAELARIDAGNEAGTVSETEADVVAQADDPVSPPSDESLAFSSDFAEDPLAELASLESHSDFSAGIADPLDDDDLLDSLDSAEGQTLSAADLDALDDNGQPLSGGVNRSVVPDLNQAELTNMTALERSEKAMDEAMSRSELRARNRAEALARAKEAEAEEPEVSEDELAEMASMAPSQLPSYQTRDDDFDSSLSLDAHDADMTLSDEELLAAFAQNSEPEDAYELPMDDSVDTDNELLHGNNMTVEQALAALDAQEQEKASSPGRVHFDENDLANFQKENGYIDIDRLLNEADESETVDNYQGPAEVAMEDYRKVMGDNAMVDVDDEENSVNAKLDLARAYIEIDDNDSARALLKEVALDGNDRQQDEARNLLDKIG
ncbi:FimV/HubP family polar landmark protein [Shewanella sp. GXUN23E]|uniref:FimV/HubP family polar landmark protein n=1 Tax=Shewanella sp. GXUN23E TaxID=3422498 RepID=UPI003D7C9F94